MAFDNVDDLRVLLATASTGSLTAAGRRCGLSITAVSAAMKRLESALASCCASSRASTANPPRCTPCCPGALHAEPGEGDGGHAGGMVRRSHGSAARRASTWTPI
jgi:hypothetical protein